MSANDEFKQAMRDYLETGQRATLRWATVKEVNREGKTMTATGMSDDLDYFDVQLGAGAIVQYPVPGTTVLVGIVEGEEALAFLISASEVERIELNGGKAGGLALTPALVGRLNAMEKDINNLKRLFSSWVPATGDGGSALKGALAKWMSSAITETTREDVENEKITQ